VSEEKKLRERDTEREREMQKRIQVIFFGLVMLQRELEFYKLKSKTADRYED